MSNYQSIRAMFECLMDNLVRQEARIGGQNGQLMEFSIPDARSLIEHGEEGIAFQNLMENLFEVDFGLTKELYNEIQQLGVALSLPEDDWSFLKELVSQQSGG